MHQLSHLAEGTVMIPIGKNLLCLNIAKLELLLMIFPLSFYCPNFGIALNYLSSHSETPDMPRVGEVLPCKA